MIVVFSYHSRSFLKTKFGQTAEFWKLVARSLLSSAPVRAS